MMSAACVRGSVLFGRHNPLRIGSGTFHNFFQNIHMVHIECLSSYSGIALIAVLAVACLPHPPPGRLQRYGYFIVRL